ncbi:hypothetical protein [Actinomadura kijaniata]|uniref:hypothetical protein n=1 Tax=Actinomadura kijaniata TaxID=46161 RepID=UPI0012F7617F|nr:hypothetical protein [Actinomadura kijaniata]
MARTYERAAVLTSDRSRRAASLLEEVAVHLTSPARPCPPRSPGSTRCWTPATGGRRTGG